MIRTKSVIILIILLFSMLPILPLPNADATTPAATIVQKKVGEASGGATTVTFNSPVVKWNMLIAYAGTIGTFTSVTDSVGNTWTLRNMTSTGTSKLYVWTATASSNASLTVTFNSPDNVATKLVYYTIIEVKNADVNTISFRTFSTATATATCTVPLYTPPVADGIITMCYVPIVSVTWTTPSGVWTGLHTNYGWLLFGVSSMNWGGGATLIPVPHNGGAGLIGFAEVAIIIPPASSPPPPVSGSCVGYAATLLNPEADKWIYADEKFYQFEAQYRLNFSVLTSPNIYYFQTSDNYHNITISYNYSQRSYTVIVGDDYVKVPKTNSTGWISYDSTNFLLSIRFPIWFSIKIEDTLGASASLSCGGSYAATALDYNIYNHGGLTEQTVSNSTYASFPSGGEWFESCVQGNAVSYAQANQTWRKAQHLNLATSLRIYANDSGVWRGEDQLFQHSGLAGGGENWSQTGTWNLDIYLYAWDTVTQTWITLGNLLQTMQSGDKDGTHEWIWLNDRFIDSQNSLIKAWRYYGWIETEPRAAHSEYIDVWFNKINSSSVLGMRSSPEYYGLVDSGGWLFWSSWNPLKYNNYTAQAFIPLRDGNGLLTRATQFDLMKIGVKLSTTEVANSTSVGGEWRICLDDSVSNTVKLQDHRQVMYGIDTPIWQEPKTPEKTISGFFAPLLSGIMWLINQAVGMLTSAGELVWVFIRAYFPWLAEFYDTMVAFITSTWDLTMVFYTGMLNIFSMVMGQFWVFGFINGFISQVWLVVAPTLVIFQGNATIWITLLIIVFGFIPFGLNLAEGRLDKVHRDLDMVWGFMRTVMAITYMIISTLVGWLIGVFR